MICDKKYTKRCLNDSTAHGYARRAPCLVLRRHVAPIGFGRIAASENRGTEYLIDYGINWMRGGTKRHCDGARLAPQDAERADADVLEPDLTRVLELLQEERR